MTKIADMIRESGYFGIALYVPEKDVNVGTVLRSAYAFGGAIVYIIGANYRHQSSDTCRAIDKLPVVWEPTWESFLEHKPFGSAIVPIEITENAKPLEAFTHPKRAIYVLGPEGSSLPHKITDIFTPLKIQTKVCLNLAVCASIIMYDRNMKRSK